jgi:hypothetical protein
VTAGEGDPPDEMGPAAAATAHRHIRSFALRRGRFTQAQRRAHDEILPRLAIAYRPARLDLAAAFGRDAPVVLEIGFGMGRPPPRSHRHGPTSTSSAWRFSLPASARWRGAPMR